MLSEPPSMQYQQLYGEKSTFKTNLYVIPLPLANAETLVLDSPEDRQADIVTYRGSLKLCL